MFLAQSWGLFFLVLFTWCLDGTVFNWNYSFVGILFSINISEYVYVWWFTRSWTWFYLYCSMHHYLHIINVWLLQFDFSLGHFISFLESWIPTSQCRASPFRDHEECTSSNNESANWFRAFGTFWWSCKSFSCIVSQWNNENNCTTSTLRWCCNEGIPVGFSVFLLLLSFMPPIFIYLIFNSILAFYKHFQFRLEFLLLFQEIFQHIVGTFEKLSNVKSHCYSKAAQILDNVSKVRACVMLLDLECDTMVVDIIKLFLRIIRYQPSMCSFLL